MKLNKGVFRLAMLPLMVLPLATFVSCSSVDSGAVGEKTIDPRFIGTWGGQATYRGVKRDVVLSLEPTGKGAIHARGGGQFDRTPIKWSTRSNILELKENVSFFKTSFTVNFGNAPYRGYGNSYRSYGQQRYGYNVPPPAPSPLGGIRRYNVVAFEAKQFTAKDVANPRIVDFFVKYSDRPTSDPYPVFSWMDNSSRRY